jgi:DNA-binding transcriptional ArsR family regulator
LAWEGCHPQPSRHHLGRITGEAIPVYLLTHRRAKGLYIDSIFLLLSKCNSNVLEIRENVKDKVNPERIARYADMFAAMGNDARLRILRLLLSAHPDGMVVSDIQNELGIPNSTLSHHLEKLRNEQLVGARRDGTFLWYTANTEALQEVLTFLYAECCTRNKAIKPETIVQLCK